MKVLGISAFFHDSAACLIVGGKIVAAVQEERFSRIKNDPSFPIQSIRYCLQSTETDPGDLSAVVFFEKPFLKFDRLLETWLAAVPFGIKLFHASFPIWTKEKIFQKNHILKSLNTIYDAPGHWRNILTFSEHHLSHAASAFYPSPYEEAAIITIDGVGEWTTTSIHHGQGKTVQPLAEIHFPHSLGLLYSAFTQYLGFKVNSGEYKVMGLASYGKPVYAGLIKSKLVYLEQDGTFRLNMKYFSFLSSLTMTNRRFHDLFGGPPRVPESAITAQHQDIAASIQDVLEEAILGIARKAKALTGSDNLCLAGGVALNCTANGKLQRSGLFRHIWVQPAAGDAGGALGAALAWYYMGNADQSRNIIPGKDGMRGALLGPAYSDNSIRETLRKYGLRYHELEQFSLIRKAAEALAKGEILGWHQGRMEFGPRALGARSILANPMLPDIKDTLNLKIKRRESFRPFAPAILEEKASEYFALDTPSPYMLFSLPVLEHVRNLPGTTHIDGSSRLQTVDAERSPLFHQLVTEFYRLTGCPVLLNTSFNIRGEPIVMSPGDSIKSAIKMKLDKLAIGNILVELHA